MILPSFPSAGRSGAALISVLAVLTFLAVIIVSLVVGMRYESEASHSYKARASAEMLAQEGVEFVRAGIATSVASSNWFSAPGMVYYMTNGARVSLPLFSAGDNLLTNISTVYRACDLNRAALSEDGLRAITGTADGNPDGMFVSWIYVQQSGVHSTNSIPVNNAADPIIGRFAYWADDESSRIDLNTAWGDPVNTLPSNHPTWVGLSSLFGAPTTATLVYTNATNSPFASPTAAARLSSDVATALSTQRYAVTHYAFSSNLNPFGQPKIALTTQQSVAAAMGSTNFLDILSTPNADPGSVGNISAAKLYAQLTNLTALISTNIPYLSTNATLAAKYAPVRPAQLALDIIDYVRSAESANNAVEPLRGDFSGSSFNTGLNGATTYIGVTRHPLITQVGIWAPPTPITVPGPPAYTAYDATLKIEVYLPLNYGIDSFPLTGQNLQVQGGYPLARPPLFPDEVNTVGDTASASPAILTPGTFAVITVHEPINTMNVGLVSGTPTIAIRIAMKGASPGYVLWELAPMAYNVGGAYALQVPICLGSGVTQFAEISDPRVNKYAGDWKPVFGDITGTQPSSWSTPVSVTPPQDKTGGTLDFNASLRMPPPKGQPGNLLGRVSSVAELGRVTTGVECSAAGIPWRTIRLQPGSGTPPDWALLDFFQAPLATNNPAYMPEAGAVAGRINPNSGVAFVNNTGLTRLAPLQALFQAGLLAPSAGAVATNIATRTLAAGGADYGLPAYFSPAQIAEIQGVADAGEASEANLSPAVDLASVQGRVFRVYSVGQALKQTGQTLTIQAEYYKEEIVRAYDTAQTHTATVLDPLTIFSKPIPQ